MHEEPNSVFDLIEDCARSQPQATAISKQDTSLTYAELLAASKRLAVFLQTKGVERGDVVPILTSRCLDMAVCVLAVVQLGAAWAPMELDTWSRGRIQAVLATLDHGVVLVTADTNEHEISNAILGQQIRQVAYDAQKDNNTSQTVHTENQNYGRAAPADTAYIIFTSGTTGAPKGVVIAHKSLLNYVWPAHENAPFNLGATPQDTSLLLFSVAFDAFYGVFFSTLCNGGHILLSESSTFVDDAKRCTLLPATPTLLSTISDTSACEAVRGVFLGGEAPTPELVRKWWTPGRKLWNAYGPTEATISVTMSELLPNKAVTLGSAIRGSAVSLRDDNLLEITALDVPGEICVVGEAVLATGYYKNEDQTSRKFVTLGGGQRIYRTGDTAKRCAHGLIFLGRQDQLVKNRGFLINVKTEVVEAILSYSDVETATAFMHNKRLVAFVTPAGICSKELRHAMAAKYDQFLVPDEVYARDRLPQTSNGKIDDAALKAELLDMHSIADSESTVMSANDALSDSERAKQCLKQAIAHGIGIPVSFVQSGQSFVDLGGNSLAAVKAISMLGQNGFTLSFQQIFSLPSIEAMADVVEHVKDSCNGQQHHKSDASSAPNEANFTRWDPASYPMTHVQRAMIRSTIANPPQGYMLISVSLGPSTSLIDESRLRESWHSVLAQHDLFRASFDILSGKISVAKTMNLNWKTINVSDEALAEAKATQSDKLLELTHAADQSDVFQPQTAFRLLLSPSKPAVLLWLVHHALVDGWSIGLIMNRIRQMLFAPNIKLPMNSQFAQYAQAADRNARNTKQASKLFWTDTMSGMLNGMDGHAFSKQQTDTGPVSGLTQTQYSHSTRSLPCSLNRLQTACKVMGFSPAVLLHASWALVLSKYRGTDNVVFGSVFSGRSLAVDSESDPDSIVGPLINTCPFPVDVQMSLSKTQFLGKVQALMLSIAGNQWSAAEHVQDLAPGSLARIFTTALFLEYDLPVSGDDSHGEDSKAEMPAWSFSRTDWPEFDLTIQVQNSEQTLTVRALFKQDQYDDATISRLLHHFENTLWALLNSATLAVSDVYNSMLQPSELFSLIHNNEQLTVPYSGPATLKEAFELGVKQWPDAIAIDGPSPQPALSYRKLDTITHSLALTIRRMIRPGDAVALVGDGSCNWLIGIISIIKAGAVYLPLDIKLPASRMKIMTAAAGATLCVYPYQASLDKYPDIGNQTLVVPDSWPPPAETDSYDDDALSSVDPCLGNPDDYAYIMFTSGTTGSPKGIRVTHRAALSHLAFPPARMHARPGRRHGQVFSPGFDVNIAEVFGTLCYGATLVLKDMDDPYAHLSRVDAAMITPSLLSVLPVNKHRNLDTIYLIGEAVPQSLSDAWAGGRTLYNFYGPCECTIAALYKRLLPGEDVTLGRAIPRVGVYILDRHMQPVPVGVVGEIFLSGVQVMREYIGQGTEAATARAFMSDPFISSGSHEQPMYRTGDLGVLTEDMEVRFLGRVDHQVKVRGYRIELGEIENEIQNSHDDAGVRANGNDSSVPSEQAVALVSQDTLYAAVTPETVDVSKIQFRLRRVLPSYAVPQRIVAMSSFPITINQKLDRKKLLDIIMAHGDGTAHNSAVAVSEAVSKGDERIKQSGMVLGQTEILLEDIWKRTIASLRSSTSPVSLSPHDDFLALGGNSLAQITVAQRVSHSLGQRIPLSLFLIHTILRSLAAAIDEYCATAGAADKNDGLQHQQSFLTFLKSYDKPVYGDATTISHLEKVFIDMHQNCPSPAAFNVAHIVTLSGPMEVDVLQKAIQHVTDMIGCFRTQFVRSGEAYTKRIRPVGSSSFPVDVIVTSDHSSSVISSCVDEPFDLEDERLARVAIIEHAQTEALPRVDILLVQHHLITDQVSIRLFFARLCTAYNHVLSGTPLTEDIRDDSYSAWAAWKNMELALPLPVDIEQFWIQHLKNNSASKTRLLQPTGPLKVGQHAPIRSLSAAEVSSGWPIDVFVSVTALALNKVLSCKEVTIGIPFLDRVESGTEQIAGVFLDTLPLRLEFDNNNNNTFIGDSSRGMQRLVPLVRGLVQGVLSHAIPSTQIQRLTGIDALFDVMLVLNRKADSVIQDIDIPGVTASTEPKRAKGAKFPLLVEFMDRDDGSIAIEVEHFEEAISAVSVAAITEEICSALRSFTLP